MPGGPAWRWTPSHRADATETFNRMAASNADGRATPIVEAYDFSASRSTVSQAPQSPSLPPWRGKVRMGGRRITDATGQETRESDRALLWEFQDGDRYLDFRG